MWIEVKPGGVTMGIGEKMLCFVSGFGKERGSLQCSRIKESVFIGFGKRKIFVWFGNELVKRLDSRFG